MMLWHQQLGHMSEKGLKIMHDQSMLSRIRPCDLDLCERYMFGK